MPDYFQRLMKEGFFNDVIARGRGACCKSQTMQCWLLLLAELIQLCSYKQQVILNLVDSCCLQGYLVGVTVQGVGYRMEPVPETTIAAALAARRGAADNSSSKRRIIWEQEAEKTNIAYPHKQPAKAVRLKVSGLRTVLSAVLLRDRHIAVCLQPE